MAAVQNQENEPSEEKAKPKENSNMSALERLRAKAGGN